LPFGRVVIAKTTHLGDLVISFPWLPGPKQRDPHCTVFSGQPKRLMSRAVVPISMRSREPESAEELLALLVSLEADIFLHRSSTRNVSAKAAHARHSSSHRLVVPLLTWGR
jgi:hypothetical protein